MARVALNMVRRKITIEWMKRPEPPVILCVDDERIVLLSLKSELRSAIGAEARIETAESGEEALALVDELVSEGRSLALVVSDLKMPVMSGDVLLSRIKDRSPATLNVLLTGYADLDAVANAVNTAGLYRYLPKPWQRDDLLLTVREALKSWRSERLHEEKNRTIETLNVALVMALENVHLVNDNGVKDTGEHVRRVGEYSRVLAEGMALEEIFVKRIGLYASLHDIGKIGVPREILVSGLRYEPEERDIMSRHVLYGGRMLDIPGIDSMARNVALYHHERWDGKGYSSGLSGEGIPLEARIVAVADVFDAMTTTRSYQPRRPAGDAVAEILSGSGTAFDPRVVEAFRLRLPVILALCGCGEPGA